MILPPFAAPLDFKIGFSPTEKREEEWYIFSKDRLLVDLKTGSLPSSPPFALENSLFLGTYQNKNLFSGALKREHEPPSGWSWNGLRSLHSVLSDDQFSIGGRALQLIEWDRTNTFCGCCGAPTTERTHERCKECLACGNLAYPKLSTAVVVLIRRGEKILLARSPHFPPEQYSVLAGFLDPGETLEQCVAREVFEEVGVEVENIQYFGSQPWPLSRSFMIAFTCDWKEGEILIDKDEIESADWFEKDHLPVLPSPISLSRLLIDSAYL